MHELRYALRGLRRSPTVTAVAILSLALGIGASTAIFSVANAVLVRALPVKNPAELVLLQYITKKGNIFDSFSYADYLAFRDTSSGLAGLAAVAPAQVNLASNEATERVAAHLVSGNYFGLLGVGARVGRLIGRDDDVNAGGHPVCVISSNLWQRRFGSAPDVPGRRIQLNGRPYTVIGVVAQEFRGTEQGSETQVYIPLMMAAEVLQRPVDNKLQPPFLGWEDWLKLVGRRETGVTASRVESVLDARFSQMSKAHQDFTFESSSRHGATGVRSRLQVVGGRQGFDDVSFTYQRPLQILMVLVGLLLSIACANVANLLLARAAGRRKEIAVRIALGAGRWQLIRQLAAESAVLTIAGAIAGLVLSIFLCDLLLRATFLGETQIDARPDLTVMGFLVGVSCLTALLFGLAPALAAARAAVAPALKSQGAGSGRRRGLFGGVLVVAQVTLSVTLLAGSGLLLRSLHNLQSIEPGFRPQNVVLASVNPGASHYTSDQSRALITSLIERAEKIPGVQAVSASLVSPLSGGLWLYSLDVPGYQHAAKDVPMSYFNAVGPGYFSSIGARLRSGREFTRQDHKGTPLVAVVNEEMARKFWPGREAVGQVFESGYYNAKVEVVGVVHDSVYRDLREKKEAVLYVSMLQGDYKSATLDLRVDGDPSLVFKQLQAVIRQVDGAVPLYGMRTLEAQIAGTLSPERMLALVSTIFAVLALVLATAGLYGVMAYRVAQRGREIAIRMALGAAQGRVVSKVMSEGLWLVGAGVLFGVPLSLAVTRWISSFLYGLQPGDVTTYVAIVGLLFAAAVAATLVPSRRASRVDPVVVLRCE